ncbi:hypothetical protein LTR95_003468 [Oleoguttula sp. CCFEE 5521]
MSTRRTQEDSTTSRDWIHIGTSSNLLCYRMNIAQADPRNLADVNPDNVLVDWDFDGEGQQTVNNAVLGDFDLTFKSENAKPCQTPYALGNVMWRSPEGHTGRGLTRALDIYSFGLMCIYALGGDDFLLLDDYKKLVDRSVTPE